MKIKILTGMLLSVAVMIFSGCGGGGGGTPAAPGTPPVVPPGTPTVVSGTPFKGPFDGTKASVVNVFKIDGAGLREATPFKTTKLDAFGSYSVDISPYAGPIVVEVTGTYKDEATGLPVVMDPAGAPLRAVISNAAGNVTVNVTPLTELAAKKAGGVLTKTTIDAMNANIAALFKVDDIFNTKPVDATTAASATATALERNQALVFAAISQLVKNSGGQSLDAVLTSMSDDITVSAATPTAVAMGDTATAGFKTAMFDFIKDPKNLSGVTDVTTAPGVGALRLAHLKISIDPATLAAGAKIGAIDFTFNLPAGITLSKDAITGQVASGVVVISGVAVPVSPSQVVSLATLNLQSLRTLLTKSDGFLAGEFINISCTVPAVSTVTAADFNTAITAATPLTATDMKGAPIAGVKLTSATELF